MPSVPHDALVTLFRNRPTMAPELLRDVLHADVPPFDHVRIGEASLGEIVPTEYRADLVLLLEGASPGEVHAALVLEAQLRRDPDKRWSWPVYLTNLRARLRCPVVLVVVANDASVAAWSARPIEMGHPSWVLTPLVLGPSAVPAVRDVDAAVEAPELAVLSAMVHGADDDALEIARAALAAAARLDDERSRLYADLVIRSAHEDARAILEALMASGNYEYQSDFARRYVAQGRAEGEAKGRAEGRAQAVLDVLRVRGIDISAEMRERILSCTESALLDAWLERAVTAKSVSDVVGG
ncbi:MAG TPA: hypothetical protein VGG39_20965 [Polyangiaceae bacterium]|jgi:hypothetical protein